MSGQRDLAREMLAYVVYLDPANADGWLWLSGVVDSPEQVRYCLERTLRIDPENARALRGMEWLNARQADIDEARAAAERVKPYWQTSKPKPLLDLVKKQRQAAQDSAVSSATATGETRASKPVASWTAISATIPGTRTSRSNLPTMPVSPGTLEQLTGASAPVKDPVYRDEVLAIDDELSPRFVTNVALRHLWKAVQKVTGQAGLEAMLESSGLGELAGYFPEPDESPSLNFTSFSSFVEAMEEFYGPAVVAMQLSVGREILRQELALKGKLAASKGISFKLMPAEKKLQTVLMELADACARMGMETYFEEQKGGYLFVVETCPYCFGRLTNARCNVTAGFLGAGIEWATGFTLQIEETSCRGLDELHCGYWIAY
jgi:hypothetical protein